MTLYNVSIILVNIILCGLTNIRIACYLAKRWAVDGDTKPGIIVISTALAIFISWLCTDAAITFGGNLYGLGCCLAGMPVIGFLWAYVIGTIKVFERVLQGLVTRLG